MPAKPSTAKTAKPAAASSTAKPVTAKTSRTAPASAAPEAPAPKTVKMARPSGANAATVTRKSAIDPRPVVSSGERDRLIAEAAYYRAEARGFAPGDEQADWFAAAQDVDSRYRCEG